MNRVSVRLLRSAIRVPGKVAVIPSITGGWLWDARCAKEAGRRAIEAMREAQ